MATQIPKVVADLELQLATAIAIGDTSFTLSSATDDDGQALAAGVYVFAVDSGTSNKEYLLGQVNGTAVTSVYSVSRQGVQTSGAVRAHRVGAPVILTNFAVLQLVADTLRGTVSLDGANPLIYDTAPTLADGKELATVQYVLDNVAGGTVAFNSQVITATGGEAIVAGNLVYFKTSDQEWYKTDADTAATVDGVQLGIALGSGSDGVSITSGVQISGTYTTTGLTAGALYYASNTAGAISTSAGTTSRVIGIALSTTKLLIISRTPKSLTDNQEAALAGGGSFGAPGATNKFVTEDFLDTKNSITRTYNLADSPATWTKPTGLTFLLVEVWGGGGSGASGSTTNASGGGGGAYNRALIPAASLGATETVTIGAGGAAATNATGNAGGTTSFGTWVLAYGGGAGAINNKGGGGGGVSSAGANGVDGGAGGSLVGGAGGSASVGGQSVLGGGGGGDADTAGGASYFGGGGGGRGTGAGGASYYGGGGGGGSGGSGTSGGASKFGGNGGAGGDASPVPVAGSVPGGGGGGSSSTAVASGAGGAGRCQVTEYYV